MENKSDVTINMPRHTAYTCLKVMDMLLYKHAYEPETVVAFKSVSDAAKYFREFLHLILPKEYQYQSDKDDTMAER